MSRTILFLDFDDVFCLNNPLGGYDVLEAFGEIQHGRKTLGDFAALWNTIFDPCAASFLEEIHKEFQPIYVLSTSWTRFLDREALVTVMRQTGLGFVAGNLHQDWETVKGHNTSRRDEIWAWLARNPECAGSWVIVDDVESGTGLQALGADEGQFVVLCEVDVGLTADRYGELRRAFLRRGNIEQQGLPAQMLQDIAVSRDEADAGQVAPYAFGPSREVGRG